MKVLLKNGKIYDGTGSEAFVGDILYEDDRIIKVGKIDDGEADEVHDLSGLSVSSGFIDAHSHNDWFAIKKEPEKYFEPFIRQGFTTFVTGNCGVSEIGFEKDCGNEDLMGGGLFFYKDTTGVYGSAGEFFDAIDRNNPCNIAALVGHCSARAGVNGNKSGKLTPEAEKKMLDVIEENLKQGACGVSLGLMYEPGLYADTEELRKVAELCVKYDKPLTVHPRANSSVSMAYSSLFGRSHLLRAVDELVEVSKGLKGLKLQYSHAIFVGRKSFKDKTEFLQIMHKLREDGIDAMYDIYNELMGVSVITVILPVWYQAMSIEERNKPFTKFKLSALIKATSMLLGFYFSDIVLAFGGEECKQYEGKNITEIAKERGESELDTYLYLCTASNFAGRVNMGPYTTPEIISEQSKDDITLYMTDAWVEDHGVQNPAVYDCFPKFIKCSLEGSGDTMPSTIRKMTGATADRFMLKDRGYIREGAYSDFTIFDEEEIRSTRPDQEKAFGIKGVIINGKTVLKDDELMHETLKTSGRAIRV